MGNGYEGQLRRESDSDAMRHLPPKVRAWALLIGVVGVPGIISLVVVWVMVNTLPAIRTDQIVMQAQLTQHLKDSDKTAAEQKAILDQILLTLRITCEQGEKTLEGKRRCSGR
jgi:hypothetical protein